MGLKSLLKVAQGKNAESVSFEDNFLKKYEEAVRRKELAERQIAPSDYIRPSSMYGCERMIFFQRVHSGSLNGEQDDVPLIEICQSGTDRHLDIQHIVEMIEGVECLDLEEVVKEANQKGIKTEFVGWNEDHTEARCKNDELSIFFQPDGVIRFMGKEVILEVKTESTYQFSNRYEPKEDHKWQATSYGLGLGIDHVLFLYEDRNFCRKKAYLWKITDEMKERVKAKIHTVNTAVKTGIPPEKNEDKCTYCKYKNECSLVDAGKWEHPNPPEISQNAQKASEEDGVGKNTSDDKKGQESPKTASTAKIKEVIAKHDEVVEMQEFLEASRAEEVNG
jgi:CRISPR/Cas system-associated exonuclease Cas4 (RecB family)